MQLTLGDKIGLGFALVYSIAAIVIDHIFKKEIKERLWWEYGTEDPKVALAHIANRQVIKHLEKKERS